MSLRDFLSKAIQLKVLLVGLVRGNLGDLAAALFRWITLRKPPKRA